MEAGSEPEEQNAEAGKRDDPAGHGVHVALKPGKGEEFDPCQTQEDHREHRDYGRDSEDHGHERYAGG